MVPDAKDVFEDSVGLVPDRKERDVFPFLRSGSLFLSLCLPGSLTVS